MDSVPPVLVGVALTRLLPPRTQEGAVYRRRLTDRVLEPGSKLVVVSGPAGSGKSTLLSQAYAAEPGAVWLSITSRDVDAAVFWTAVIESIGLILPGFGDGYRRRLEVVGADEVADVVPLVVNELADADLPITVFLDDVHLLTGAHTRQSLTQFLELLPAGVRVVIAGRGTPPLPLGRFGLDGSLLRIDQDELAMDHEEAATMLDVRNLHLEPSQFRALFEQTEGWVAGLAWSAIALDRRGDTDDFVAALAAVGNESATYLVEEVVDQWSPEQRQFMLDTSILTSFCDELCDALRVRTDSGRLIKALDNTNSFLINLDRAGKWYRFHHLVHDVLEAQLRLERPTDVATLHTRASAWHRDHGEIAEAIRHALAAGDQIEAADILCANWWSLVETGRSETVGALLGSVDPETIRSYQPLAITAAQFFCVDGSRDLAHHYYRVAEQGSFEGEPPDGTACIESALAIMRATFASDGVAKSLADGTLAYDLEGPASPWRPFTAIFVGLGHTWQGDLDAAAPYFDEIVTWQPPNEPLAVYALAETALAALARGEVAAARATATSACALAEQNGTDSLFFAAPAYAARALTELAAGDQQAAATALQAAETPMKRITAALPLDEMRTRMLLADAALQLGFVRLAVGHVERAEQIDRKVADTGVLAATLAGLRARLDEMIDAGTGEAALSDRELDVLALLPSELTVREIGAQLFLSKNTIKTRVRRIFQELDVHTRTEAVSRARQLDLLPAPEPDREAEPAQQ